MELNEREKLRLHPAELRNLDTAPKPKAKKKAKPKKKVKPKLEEVVEEAPEEEDA